MNLQWYKEPDKDGNTEWAAQSCLCFDEDTHMEYRIGQVLLENEIRYIERSDSELMPDASPRIWNSLYEAEADMQDDESEILRAVKEENGNKEIR